MKRINNDDLIIHKEKQPTFENVINSTTISKEVSLENVKLSKREI